MLAVVRQLEVVLALSVAAVTGCGGAYGSYADETHFEYDSARSEIQLLKVEQQIDGQAQRLSFSEPLYAGDKTALTLSLPEPLFVYVVNIAPDGTWNLIWPGGQPERVSGVQRIPSDGGWFTLTGKPGQEVIAVVATRDEQPITGAGKQRLLSAVKLAVNARTSRLQSALPPGMLEAGHATMGVRGENLALSGQTVSVASYDPVVMILDIDHRAVDDAAIPPAELGEASGAPTEAAEAAATEAAPTEEAAAADKTATPDETAAPKVVPSASK